MRFRTEVLREGKTATGLQVPDEVVAELGAGKRPAVRITINSYSYRTTAMSMGGRYMVPLAAEHRDAAAVSAGEKIDVEIELDTEVREVVVPSDLAAALAAQPSVQAFFDQLSFTHRKEWVRWIEDAKKPETRQLRLTKTVDELREGRRTH
jgi:hypothetical protein